MSTQKDVKHQVTIREMQIPTIMRYHFTQMDPVNTKTKKDLA